MMVIPMSNSGIMVMSIHFLSNSCSSLMCKLGSPSLYVEKVAKEPKGPSPSLVPSCQGHSTHDTPSELKTRKSS